MNDNRAQLLFSRWSEWHRGAMHRLFVSTNADEAQANRLIMLGWLALIGFPFYYWMWAEVFPQPYENLGLRLAGVAIAAPFFFARRLQREKWFDAYFFATITYVFPFFFTFMFLMNGGSQVWAQSLLIAMIVLFHFEVRFALASAIIGVSLAFFAHVLIGHGDMKPYSQMLYNLPILLFAILCTSIVRIGRSLLMDEKLNGMASALGTVAHELRTPLRSVDANAQGLRHYLPELSAFYREQQDASGDDIRIARLAMIGPALDRIQVDVQYMNSAIDLLLVNASDMRAKAQIRDTFRIKDLVTDAIVRYPFEDMRQRSLVQVEIHADFAVDGSRDLCMMVLFNLLKNALRAVARASKGTITISTDQVGEVGKLMVRDTGCGILASEVPRVFQRFYSYPPNAGTGIGLAFCRETLAMWGATIECRSEFGVFTEFTICFARQEQPSSS